MTFRQVLTVAALGFAVPAAFTASARAQTSDENRDADALAADMRLLAADPDDIEALIVAGELTLKMGDPTAAAGFLGRAEKLDPNNPRIKAGWGSLMVRAERPGEALRRFQAAEAGGVAPVRFAADRGLAYDLIGQQDRAQRDYRLVLRDHPDDEVTRRYALSLGISGNKDEALRQLDPLIQRSDRAAWRSRAFILAMSGDAGGADRIAMTMMAPGMGAALAPFFRRLPELSPTDRAFAVTFGELRATPERVADARTAPSLAPLGPDPYAPRPVVAAAAAPPPPPADDRGDRRRKKRRKDERAAAVVLSPAPAPAAAPLAPPAYVASSTPAYTPPPVYRPGTTIAAQVPTRGQSLPVVTPPTRGAFPVTTPPTRTTPPITTPPTRRSVASPGDLALPVVTLPRATIPAVAPPNAATTATAPVVVAAAPPSTPALPEQGVADQPSAAEAGVAEPTAIARVSEDSVLARIVADANAAPLPRPVRVARAPDAPPPVAPKPSVAARPEAADDAAATARGRRDRKDAAADLAPSPTDKDARGKPVNVSAVGAAPALDRNGCPLPPGKGRAAGKSRAAVRTPPLSTRCKAIAAKAAADKQAEAEAKSQPARVWVQVAGGANAASLEQSWKIMHDRAPDLLRGRQGWTTPLRSTNRVLTGPFKSADEAQEFVNKLTRSGVPAFVFTSTRGQKVDRLGGK